MRLRQVILISADISSLSSFLSDLFDLEVMPLSQDVCLENDAISFLLKEDKKRRVIKTKETIIDIALPDINELHAIIKKVEFINYRLDQQMKNVVELKQDGEWSFFEIQDPDQRVWRFSARGN